MNLDNATIKNMYLELLPYSISASLHLTIRETNSVRKLHLLVHSYRQLVHFLGLCHLSDYLQYPNIRDVETEEIIAGLKRPSLGHWVRVIRDVPRILMKKNKSLFIEEWHHAWGELEKVRYQKCIRIDMFDRSSEFTAIEAFLRLRNALAHGAIMPEENICEDIYQHYFPIMEDILKTFDFLRSIVVYRLVAQSDNDLNVVELRGQIQPFPSNILNRNICFPESNLLPDCFLGKIKKSHYLSLIPMIIGSLEERDSYTGFSEPLLSYDGLGNKRVYYLGIRRTFESESHYDVVFNTLFARPVRKLSCWQTSVANVIMRNTLEIVSINRGVKYFPAVFHDRKRYSALIDEFIQEMSPKTAGLLFVAESGIGKTSLLCHTSVNLLNNEEINYLPLLIMGKNLRIYGDYSTQIYEEEKLGYLGNYLKQTLGFEETINNWKSLIEQLKSIIDLKDREQVKPKLVLMIDAINEAPDPVNLLQEFDYVVGLARKIPWLRCIGTIRKGTYEITIAKLSKRGIKWPNNDRAYLREPDDSGKLKVSILLSSFSEYEAKLVYENYQKQAESGIDVPACLTAYQDLPDVFRQMIRHPLILGILMQTYNQQTIPSNIALNGLFERFNDECLTSSQAKTVAHITSSFLDTKRPYLSQGDIHKLSEVWKKGKDEYEMLVCLDPIEQLLDLGILIPNSQEEYSFAHQLYFEFMLFRHFLGLNLDVQQILEQICNIVMEPDKHLEEEAGALRLLLLEKIKPCDTQIIDRIIEMLQYDIYRQFFTPLFFELQRLRSEVCDFIEQGICQQTSKPVLESAIEIYRTIGNRDGQLKVTQQLLYIEQNALNRAFVEIKHIHLLIMSNRIDEAEAKLNMIKNYAKSIDNVSLNLSVYIEEGYINVIKADSQKALTAYSKALSLLEQLRCLDVISKEEYLLKKREILGGRGCVEHNIDENEACAASHREALTIDRQLNKREAIALDLVNLADAYWGCHRYGQSLLVYQDAIEAAAKVCYQDAMDVALIGRGIVFWSMGRLKDADESISAGLEIATQLNYCWDLSYGLIYKSNILASQRDIPAAINTNKKALVLAEQIGAEYLVALASSYLFEKYELLQPGLSYNREFLENLIINCQRLDLRGVLIMLTSVRLMNIISNNQFLAKKIEVELQRLIDMIAKKQLIKGAWELMGLHLIGAMKRWRRHMDTMGIEDIIDEICERKASDMNSEDTAIYLASRKAWKTK